MCAGQRGRCETDRLQRKGETDSKSERETPSESHGGRLSDCPPMPTRTRAVQHAGNIKKKKEKKKEKGNPNRRGGKKGDEKKKSAALKRVS